MKYNKIMHIPLALVHKSMQGPCDMHVDMFVEGKW